jgi:hypothetical protein
VDFEAVRKRSPVLGHPGAGRRCPKQDQ